MQKKSNKSTEVGVLLEHIDDKVTLIAEQYVGLNKKVDILTEKVESVSEDVEVIKMDVEFIKHELKRKVNIDFSD